MSEESKIPPYFYFNTKYCDWFQMLNNEQAGAVIKYICSYVKQTELPTIEDQAAAMLIEFIKTDIDHSFCKYRAQCENGKKGGAPKGNKNAAKKKATEEPPINELFGDIAYRIADVIFWNAQKEDFAISEYLSKSQIASIAACYHILDIDDISDIFDGTMKEFIINKSARQFCNELKQYAAAEFEEGDETFTETFARAKQAADKLLKMSLDETKHFYSKCDLALEATDISEAQIKEHYDFTEEEIKQILSARRQQNNPKTTQNNQI